MRRFLVLSVVCAAVTVSVPILPAQTPSRPNILLVTIDTLRADRLGSYGYAPARTPTLDQLAASGVRFDDATAHAPLTYPSHVSIFTGRYPGAFGVRLNGMDPLPSTAVTLAERLKANSYRTGAVVGSLILDQSYGLAQGFDDYDDAIAAAPRATMAMADLQRTAGEVTAAGLRWIGGQQGPWFLWIHYYDPHLPYTAPAKYAAAAPGRPYDAEISYVDAELGSLLRGLDRARTAVVVTSDHGEALGEHGEPDHGFFLYDATLRVPLIVAAPGLKPRVVREQVRSIDIAPTIAQLAGVPVTATDEEDAGESLKLLLDGGKRDDVPVSLAESWYPRLHFGWSELKSARVGEWKYIAAPKPELYDLRTDAGERRNVVADRAPVAGRLAGTMQKITSRFAQHEPARTVQPDAATVQRLQALGYVGSFAPATTGTGEDPKAHVADYRRYRELFNRAFGLLGRDRPGEAATVLEQLLKVNVRAFEAHLYLGNAYSAMGRHEAAIGEYEVASQLNPGVASPHFEAAKALSAKGETAAAIARARRGLELEPQSFYGHYTLGVVFQKASQWTEALVAFGRAVDLNGSDARARANLAGAAMRLDNLQVARAQFEAMVVLGYQVAPAHYNLGVIAMRRGDRAEAGRQYKLALQADPAFAPARSALAKLK